MRDLLQKQRKQKYVRNLIAAKCIKVPEKRKKMQEK